MRSVEIWFEFASTYSDPAAARIALAARVALAAEHESWLPG